MYSNVNMGKIVSDLSAMLAGIKGRRKAKAITEDYLARTINQPDAFSAYRDSHHHYHIVTNSNGAGHSLFVSFDSQGKVKEVSSY